MNYVNIQNKMRIAVSISSYLIIQLVLINGIKSQIDLASQASVGFNHLIPETSSMQLIQPSAQPAQFGVRLQRSILHDAGYELPYRAGVDPATQIAKDLIPAIINHPGFDIFLQQVMNGNSQVITGLYVEDLFGLEVLQQPTGNATYVSDEDGVATQFSLSAMYGVIGLLAHNYLSGKHFLNLELGQEIRLVYGDGSYRRYEVTGIADYERLTRSDVHSDFRDLQSEAILSSREIFNRFYRGENYLTLQTCLEGEGIYNWGVRMVSAGPLDDSQTTK